MQNFDSLQLPTTLLNSLAAMKFTVPTPVQIQAIPPALEGKDVLASAQTGTGKTAAFGVPLVAHLMASGRSAALVMTPTRELALQVKQTLDALCGPDSNISSTLIIGGESMPKQVKELRNKPRLIVGTPGRINDHLEQGNLMLHMTNFLVLDETDRMLDMGFERQIEKIVKFLPKSRQTLLFSATLPKNIIQISTRYLNQPIRVAVNPEKVAAPKIKQEILHLEQSDKFDALVDQLDQRNGSVILFMKTKWNAKKMADRLEKSGHTAEAIHGDLSQNARKRVVDGFRNYKYRVMVATDIAARGLDIPHIEHVINYDLPQCPEDYIHRIGRTARAGAEGSSLCFLTPSDQEQWHQIAKLLDDETRPETNFPGGEPHTGERKKAASQRTNNHRRRRSSRSKRYASGSANNHSEAPATSHASQRKKTSANKPKFSGKRLAICNGS